MTLLVRRRFIQLCWLSAAIAVVSCLLLGLPGAVVLEAAGWVVGRFSAVRLGGDQVWPAALGISLVGPFAVPPVYLGVAALVSGAGLRVLLTVGFGVAVVVAVTAVGIVVAGG